MRMLAFVFPGQGSQKVGMGRGLADRYAVARRTFEEADDALGFSLSAICFDGPEEALKLTAHSQPAILTVSIAALRALEEQTGLRAAVAAGHSLGEYSALVCAGALSFADAVRLVHLRGRFMQEAVPLGQGAMAAVMGLAEDEVAAACDQAAQGEVVAPANFNGGGQVVVAGHAGAVERLLPLVKERGGRSVRLQVSAPFHCALMAPAADRLAPELARVTLASLRIPVVSNVEGAPNQDAARIPDLLVRQVTAPVRWETSVLALEALGVTRALEVGPGKVLTGLIKRIAGRLELGNVETPENVEALASAASGATKTEEGS
ncbi:MAG: ACP S-malonyltransferase [Deltaproteobacteria bacterium]|nr:ACP S-malonyltransferase [Deltaproteobacteria bacterium]